MPPEHERESVTRQLGVTQPARKHVPNHLDLIIVFVDTNMIPCRDDVRFLVKKDNKRVPAAFRMTQIYQDIEENKPQTGRRGGGVSRKRDTEDGTYTGKGATTPCVPSLRGVALDKTTLNQLIKN